MNYVSYQINEKSQGRGLVVFFKICMLKCLYYCANVYIQVKHSPSL